MAMPSRVVQRKVFPHREILPVGVEPDNPIIVRVHDDDVPLRVDGDVLGAAQLPLPGPRGPPFPRKLPVESNFWTLLFCGSTVYTVPFESRAIPFTLANWVSPVPVVPHFLRNSPSFGEHLDAIVHFIGNVYIARRTDGDAGGAD